MIADLPAAANGAERLISDRGTLKHKISGPSNTWFAKNKKSFTYGLLLVFLLEKGIQAH